MRHLHVRLFSVKTCSIRTLIRCSLFIASCDLYCFIVPVCPYHLFTDSSSLLKRLRLLACWNRDQCRSRTCRHQTFLDAPGEKWRNVVIGNDRASFASQTLVHMRSNLVQQTRADKYAITLRIKRNGGAGGPMFYCVGSQWVAVY